MRSRDRALRCAILAALAAYAAGCHFGDAPTPDAGTRESAIGINGPGGWLEGTFHAAGFAGITVVQPDVSMHAQNIMTMVNTPAVQSDFYGGFRIPVANGSYRVCWAKSGYTSACTGAIFTVNNKTISVNPIAITLTLQKKLRGYALLADGTTCLTQDKFMSTDIIGKADLLTTANVLVATTRLNVRGEWVLPDPGQGHKVRVTCAGISTEVPTTSMNPNVPFAFTWNNLRPIVQPINATAGGVDATKGVFPGTVVQLSTAATDPNGHPMTLRWRAPAGTLVDTGTTSATWTVPSSPGTFLAYFSANDGRGGYTTRAISVRVRTAPESLFSGNVRDDAGAVVAGATVTVGAATTTSDAVGHFAMKVPEADNYLINITKMGYAELSQHLRRPSRGQRFILIKAFATSIPNPGITNVITDNRDRWRNPPCKPQQDCRRDPGRVTIPPNGLLLEPPPVGELTAYIVTYDASTEALPGDQSAINSLGQPTALVSYGAVFIEVRDAAGTKYNLAPGKLAKLEIPFQSAIAAENPPPTMDMWKYNPSTGLWSERTTSGVRAGNYYVVDVPNFSTQNADIEKVNPACLYIDVAPDVFSTYTMKMRLQVPVSIGGAVRVYEKALDELRNVVYNLPTGVPYTLEVFEAVGGNNILKQTLTGSLGGWWGGTGNPGVSDPDCAVQTVNLDDVVGSSGAFNRFLDRKGVGDGPQAAAYYTAIDPGNTRATLGGFWNTNGFDPLTGTGADAHAAFINFNDLGFGRDMHCRQGPGIGDIACYVTNYGASDQAPGNFDLAQTANQVDAIATVAMEYSPGPLGPNIVKFYVYAGGVAASPRIQSADLDGAGPKFVPNLCLNCHGGSYFPSNPLAPTGAEVDMGSSFREFDIYSFRDGTLGDIANGLTDILAQESDFLALNQRVLATAPQPAISEIVNLWYNSTLTLPFDPNAVPPLWSAAPSLYLDVVAKACRTCHVAQDGLKAWATYDQFRTFRLNTLIPFAVCFGDPAGVGGPAQFELDKRFRSMPHANVTFKNFWLDPTAYNTLGNFTGPGWPTSINADPALNAQCIP